MSRKPRYASFAPGVGAGRAGEELVNMYEHAAFCRDRRTHRREAAVHPRLQFLELLTLVDVGSRAVNLVGAFVSPEGDGDLLILLQVRKRLVEELVGDVDRLGIDDFLHSHRVGRSARHRGLPLQARCSSSD